ncbi:FHA domain protein [Novipirellula aureliae]|uniref:FHA domain protein n=1 Tax=Novipirellula aureliae TaxID=2527966 RepID=A0A5C6E845_9BACT|nr:FHA domain-containing protein [Novipirellula aureliae]TWU45010.1 FHA domain protein [Novipirellula aureliae]
MALRVTIRVDGGLQDGQRRAIRPGDRLLVGRSLLCDWPFEHDQRMSSNHFEIVMDTYRCLIRDMQSANGLNVGGVIVEEAVLSDGDVIQAGSTRLLCEVEGASSVAVPPLTQKVEQASPMVPAASGKRLAVPITPMPPESPAVSNAFSPTRTVAGVHPGVTYTVTKTEAETWIYRGAVTSKPSLIAAGLCHLYRSILIVEPKAIEQEKRDTVPLEQFLFDYMEEPPRRMTAPICLTGDEVVDRMSLVDEAFGKNEIVLVLAKPADEKAIESIRESTGVYLRPKACLPQLTETTADMAASLLKELVGVFVETDEGKGWAIVTQNDLQESLASLGWKQRNG